MAFHACEGHSKEAGKRDAVERALQSILGDYMLDYMYEGPKEPNIGKVIITRPYLEKNGGPRIEMRG